MTDRQVELWLFYPQGIGRVANEIRHSIKAECDKRQWNFRERTTHLVRPEGRPIGTIKPEDATNLYKRIHRARVGVWQIGRAHAPTNPDPRDSPRNYVELHRFVRHKAYHCRLPENSSNGEWHSSLAAFRAWVNETGCENEGDPRCLPFHVFETKLDIDVLESETGRSDFAVTHGRQSSRSDYRKLQWKRPRGEYHGSDTLQVAGYELIKGFHWDVSHGVSKRRISTTSDTWEIKRNGYINVYPDAHIRCGDSAIRVYPKKSKAR